MNTDLNKITIIGAGNLGQAIAKGLVRQEILRTQQVTVSRRNRRLLTCLKEAGFETTTDNTEAIKGADLILIVVGPKEIAGVLKEISPNIDTEKQIVVSAVTGYSTIKIKNDLPPCAPVVRIMPNLAIAVGNSMTCLYADREDREARDFVDSVFQKAGATLTITEELLTPATALCASGLAFFLRSIRAASQGGTEIGFHAEDAIKIAAQTALGAATLLKHSGDHPEASIDKVTTPKGITIAGLNEMEHKGFSSSMIRGIVTSANKVADLTKD